MATNPTAAGAAAPTAVNHDLTQLLHALVRPSALIELALFAGCLALAWVLVRLWRGPQVRADSVWFGQTVVDGVLFPVMALLLALLARWALSAELWAAAVPLAVFKLVVPVLLSLVVIRVTVRVLHNAFPQSKLVRVVERSVSWLAWAAMVLWISGLMPLLLKELDAISWKIGGAQISLRNLLEGVITAVVVLMGALWLSAALEARLIKPGKDGAIDNLSIRKMAANALRALLLFVGLMFALSAAGIDLTALGVLGGALGVGIGFGLQKLAANYISGFVILAERSMRIGDMVRVDNFEGRITDITTRYTVIRSASGREAIVPNEMMITQRVENNSLADPQVLLTTVLQVSYGTDIKALAPQLQQAVLQVPRVLHQPGPSVLLSNFAPDGLELTVAFWIADAENGQLNVRSEVNLALLAALDAAAVEIPFPQRTVHLHTAADPRFSS
jgi:small-conductance mechanosensitive channel